MPRRPPLCFYNTIYQIPVIVEFDYFPFDSIFENIRWLPPSKGNYPMLSSVSSGQYMDGCALSGVPSCENSWRLPSPQSPGKCIITAKPTNDRLSPGRTSDTVCQSAWLLNCSTWLPFGNIYFQWVHGITSRWIGGHKTADVVAMKNAWIYIHIYI